MKNILFILLTIPIWTQAQDVAFNLRIPADSFLMHNVIEISYTLNNTQGWNMTVSDFEDFQILSGPNFSSNFSMINGETKQSQSMTYFIRPVETGVAVIPGAQVDTDNGTLEAPPVEVYILSNPEEKKMDYRLQQSSGMDFNFDLRAPAPKKKKRKGKVYKI